MESPLQGLLRLQKAKEVEDAVEDAPVGVGDEDDLAFAAGSDRFTR